MKKIVFFTGLLFGMAGALHSQNDVHESDIMYKKTVVRALDMREKQNKPLFARNREITSVLMKAVQNGTLKPYENDSLVKQLSMEKFLERISIPTDIPEDTVDATIEYGPDWKEVLEKMKGANQFYTGRDFYQMEIKENVIFDKQKSRMVYDIDALTIYFPADHQANQKQIQLPIASFKYEDVVNVLKDNPEAYYFNPYNDAENKNFADAFQLRLFSSYIVKVSNPDDLYLQDIYNDGYKGIMASQWAANELLEYENNLWEF